MDLKAVCRTCLKETGEMRSIYEDDSENPLSTMITSISDTTASELDGLPGQICIECVDALRQSVHFKQQCENAYETLKSVLGVHIETKTTFNASIAETGPIDATESVSSDHLYTDTRLDTLVCGPNEKCIQTEDICFFPCEMCELKFFKEESLKEHRTTHKNNKENGFKCRNCERSYTRLSHLRRHINVAHPEVNISGKLDEIRCKHCDKHFTRNEHLRRHIQVLHSKQNDKLKVEEELQEEEEDDDCESKIAVLDDKLNITKVECNGVGIAFEPELNVKTCKLDVSVKSERHSDDESMTPVEQDISYAIEENQISTISDASGSPTTPTKSIRRAKRSVKQSPDKSNKSASKSPKSKRMAVQQEKVHQCNKCDKIFNRATHLRRHMATHSDVKPYSCEICEKRFRRPDHLSIHRHHHSSIKPHVCDVCQKGFTRSEHLRKHKECRHGDKTNVSIKTEFCDICQKGFTTPKYLQVHMKSHTDRTFSCKFCEEKFGTRTELNEHQKTHVNERPFLCSECGLRFVRNDYLVIHMRRHKGEKPYKCKYCNKGFPRATDLTVHERYHTGEKTHLCTICGKGFQRAYNLLVHTRVHTGERPYKCPHCVKSFAQGNDLKAHVRRHTGERYKCDICNEGFIQGYHLTQHKRNVHNIDMKSHIRRVEKFIPAAGNGDSQEMNFYRMQQSEQLRKLQQQVVVVSADGPVDFRNNFKVISDDGTIEASGQEIIKIEQVQNVSQDSRSSDIIVTQPNILQAEEQIDPADEGMVSLNIFSGLHYKLNKLPTQF